MVRLTNIKHNEMLPDLSTAQKQLLMLTEHAAANKKQPLSTVVPESINQLHYGAALWLFPNRDDGQHTNLQCVCLCLPLPLYLPLLRSLCSVMYANYTSIIILR